MSMFKQLNVHRDASYVVGIYVQKVLNVERTTLIVNDTDVDADPFVEF